MFLSTALIICLSFLTVGLCARLNLDGHLNFIPMAMVVLAYVGYGLGFGVIPSLIAAESIPVNVRLLEKCPGRKKIVSRSTAVGILMTLEMSSTFLLSKLKPFLIDHLGIDGLFLLFAGVLFLVIILTHVALPRQSLEKIAPLVMESCPKEAGDIRKTKSSILVSTDL